MSDAPVATGRDLFLTALRGGRPDRVPIFDQLYSRNLYAFVLNHTPEHFSNLEASRLAVAVGLDASVLVYDRYPGIDRAGPDATWRSEWGVCYSLEGAGWPTGFGTEFANSSVDALAAFTPPDAHASWRWDAARHATAFLHEHGLAAVGGLRGPFAMLCWHFVGLEAAMVMTLSEPDAIAMACGHYVEHAVGLVEEWAGCGVDALFVTEDLGSTHGPLIAPPLYEKLFLPHLSRVVQEARSRRVEVILHSDGQVMPFMDLFVRAGVSALHPIERRAGMSLRECKARWGSQLAFCGNLDARGALLTGTEDQVRQAVRETMSEGADGGGYVFATDHSIGEGIPVANVMAMLDEARNWKGK